MSRVAVKGLARIKQRGSVLLPVVVAITLLAAITFMLSYQGVSQGNIVAGELERDRLRFVAEAGLAHAKVELAKNTSCASYAQIPKTSFGSDSYSAQISPRNGSPVRIRASVEMADGKNLNLFAEDVIAYEPPTTTTLQLGKEEGKDVHIDSFYPNANYGSMNDVTLRSKPSWIQRPLLEFDVSSIPAGAKIQSATLDLQLNNLSSPGVASVHRLTRSWEEGTGKGTGNADGATWNEFDGNSPWALPGGEYDASPAASIALSSTDVGRRVSWEIGDLVDGWVSGRTPNFGVALIGDGTVDNAKFSSRSDPDTTSTPQLNVVYACECGKTCGMAPPVGNNVLLVVVDPSNLTGQEADKQALIESWGHTVNLIDESDSQANFDTAFAGNDVVYIPQEINSTTLGTKLRNASIGVVNEEGEQVDELGIAQDKIFKSRQEIDVLDNSHYITELFATGLLTFAISNQSVHMLNGTTAPGLQTLGQSLNTGSLWATSLGAIQTGGDLSDGGTAAGRRVQLPWGGGTFDINALNDDGKTIMKRAIEWGAGESPVVANDGWAVGDSGSIYYTSDAGATWTPQTSGTAEALFAVNFPTPLIGYAAGAGEILLKTTDGGNTWNTLSTGTQSLWALDFLDADSGYTVGLGATVKMTTDGGSNWASQDPATTQNLRHIDFVDASTGYLVGLGGVIRKTTDGGTNWSVQNSGVTTALYSIDFTNASTGWAVGDLGVIVKTSDGGTNWNSQVSGTSNKLQSVAAIDSSTAIAVGRVGLILKTTDGGSSWVTQASGTTGDLWYVHFVDATTGYVTGQNGEILKTTDGGATWASTDLGTSVTMRAVYFAKNGAGGPPAPTYNVLLIVGNAATLGTKDAGYKALIESWGHTVAVIDDGDSQAVYDAAMDAADVVYATGSASGPSMLDKATNTTKGLVNEVNGKIDNFGFSSSTSATANFDTFSATDGTHYITEPFDGNAVTVFTAPLTNPVPGGTLAPDLQSVGTVAGSPVLGTLETGATRYDGNPSQGRRAHLPFTAAETTDMTVDGKLILQRTLEWAAGASGGGGGGGGGPTPPYLDEFNARNCSSADYAGSDGTMDWTASSWTEVGESNGSCAGLVQVAEDPDIPETGSYRLMLDERLRNVIRTVDLSGFSSATLSFDYRRYNYPTTSDYFAVLVSRDGSIWSELEQFSGIATDASYQTASHDISPFIQATTQIAFATKGINTLQTVFIDNVRITEGGGGSGPVCLGTMRDEFNAQVWSGSDGSLSWASNWSEIYEGGTPTGGDIMVIDDLGPYSARVRDNGTTNNGAGIQRQADLSAFASATLNFDYRRDGPDNANDYVTVDVSSDGGGSWTELDRFIGEGTNTTDPSYVPVSYDITAFISSNTRIRFLSSPTFGNTDVVYFDNVEICLGN